MYTKFVFFCCCNYCKLLTCMVKYGASIFCIWYCILCVGNNRWRYALSRHIVFGTVKQNAGIVLKICTRLKPLLSSLKEA